MSVKLQIMRPIHVILCMWIISISGGAQAQQITCLFDRFLFFDHGKPSSSESFRQRHSTKIVNGKTDEDTERLDGSVRATNSHLWTRLTRLGDPTFIGDFGELLILESNPEERENNLSSGETLMKGWHKSTLTSGGLSLEQTHVHTGNCLVE